MSNPVNELRSRGRPRSKASREALLSAALRLVIRHGYQSVTTELIAAEAKAGKQTIYRWWDTKAALVLDALARHASEVIEQRRPVEIGLDSFLRRMFAALQETGNAVRALMAEAQFDVDLRSELKQRLIEPRRAALRQLLQERELPLSQSVDVSIAVIYGAVWYRLLLDESLDAKFAKELVSMFPRKRRRGVAVRG